MFTINFKRATSILAVGAALALTAERGFSQSGITVSTKTPESGTVQVRMITPPQKGPINVAFVISKNANVMDIAGAWEVFQDTMLGPNGKAWHDGEDMTMPFQPYTVSDTREPVEATDGLMIVPTYTFDNAPKPQIIVIPAQGGRTEAQKKWLEANAQTADVTMSVCTGASVLAAYGLLDGQTATTHHLYQQSMQKRFPKVHFVSGTRYVENDRISTAGGLTSGIDLALHVVERYWGREVAETVADYMEYHSELWKKPDYAEVRKVSIK